MNWLSYQIHYYQNPPKEKRMVKSLQDYTRKFYISTEILESHLGGPLILEKYLKNMEEYEKNYPNKKNKMIKQDW